MDRSVLFVEDEIDMLFILGEAFEDKGYTVYKAKDGKEGLELYHLKKPALIITDIMMPMVNGLNMVREIRKTNRTIPIFFLTSLTSVSNAIEGLTCGADDYIRKPFSISEVIARAEKALDRAYAKNPECIKLASFVFYPDRLCLERKDKQIKLTGRQSSLLHILAKNLGHVVSSESIIEATSMKRNDYFASRSLQVHIVRLRHLLAEEPDLTIINERGVGYKLIDMSLKDKA